MPPKKVAVPAAVAKKVPVAAKKVPIPTTMVDSSNSESEESSSDDDDEPTPTPAAQTKSTTTTPQPQSSSDSDDSESDSDSDDSDSDDDDADQLVQLPSPTPLPTTTTPSSSAPAPLRTLKRTEVWLDIQVPPFDLGRVSIELYPDCPLALENFRALCTGEITDPVTNQKLTYAGTMIDQIHEDYIVLGEICDDADDRDGIEVIEDDFDADHDDSDDETVGGVKAVAKAQKNIQKAAIVSKEQKINIVHDTKKPAVSIYGGFFPDEPAGINRQHVKAGTVSMFAEKTNRNGSKFLITLKPHMSWLDGQYTVIGQVNNGLRTLHSLTSYMNTGETAVISNCGRLKKNATGVDKVNDFIIQAVELSQKEAPVADKKKGDDEDETKAVNCPKCDGAARYKARQLGKGLRYMCRSAKCASSFWINDDKYDESVLTKAMELKKEAKQQLHIQTVLMQSAAYRKQIHTAEKEARLEMKKAKEALEIAMKPPAKGKKVDQKAIDAAKKAEADAKAKLAAQKKLQSSLPTTTTTATAANIVYASPNLALKAQEAMVAVLSHKKEKAKAQVQGRKDHEKFVKEKKMQRGELDENGQPLFENDYNNSKDNDHNGRKRKFDEYEESTQTETDKASGPGDAVYDQWFGGGAKNKKGKGNDEKAHNKELKKIYNDEKNPEHKSMHQELSSMSKGNRRQFKRQIGIQPGPSKTMQSNMNKRHNNTEVVPKRATFKSVQKLGHAAQDEKKKKKDKTRWRDRDVKVLPDGYVSREVRRKELNQ